MIHYEMVHLIIFRVQKVRQIFVQIETALGVIGDYRNFSTSNKTILMNRCMGTCKKSTCSEQVCAYAPNLGHSQHVAALQVVS